MTTTPNPYADMRRMERQLAGRGNLPFNAHDTRDLPPLNELKAAYDKPLQHEDPLADEERRLLSVAQYVRDCVEGKRHE